MAQNEVVPSLHLTQTLWDKTVGAGVQADGAERKCTTQKRRKRSKQVAQSEDAPPKNKLQ